MKNLLLFVLAFLLSSTSIRADLGSCLVYEVKFYLKDGRVFNACFEVGGDSPGCFLDETGSNEFCNDAGVFELFKKIQKRRRSNYQHKGGVQKIEDYGKVMVYKKLHYVSPKGMEKYKTKNLWRYGFVLASDLVYLDSTDIEKTIFWQAKYSARNWLTSEIVIGSPGMLDSIQNLQYWNKLGVSLYTMASDSLFFSDDVEWGYRMINYSSKNNVAELKRLARLKFSVGEEEIIRERIKRANGFSPNDIVPKKLNRQILNQIELEYQKKKNWFWKRGVMIVKVNGTC